MVSGGPAGEVSSEGVAEQLGRVLSSGSFAGSAKLQRLLAFLVHEALAGRQEDLKEYSIALAVCDRDSSFDPKLDTVVRVQARRLRQQLELYYGGEGRFDPVLIELPKGRYIPVFSVRARSPGETAGGPPPGGRWRRRIPWLAAVAMAIGAVWLFLDPPAVFLHGDPAQWVFEGTKLKVLDDRDRICWEKWFQDLKLIDEPDDPRRAIVEDIDGDGRKEVLVSVNRVNPEENRSSLICFDAQGRKRWETFYGSPRTFGGRKFSAAYYGHVMGILRVGGKPLILVLTSHHIWYPSEVALFDAGTGKLVGVYVHPGMVYLAVARDIDGDGVPEILFAALNNPGEGLGHPALGALKLPLPGERATPGGGELAYVLFPLPDVNRATGRYPTPYGLEVTGDGRIEMKYMVEGGGSIFDLDFGFRVLEHHLADSFAAVHERLYRQRILDHRLGSREIEELGVAVRFPSAPDGNSPQVARNWRY